MKQFLNFIDGEFVATSKTFENHAPVDNRVLGLVHEAGQAEVNAAVAAARSALSGEWGKLSVVKRVDLLNAVADEINRRFDDFLDAELADTGKPHSLASHIDIPRGAANFKIFARCAGVCDHFYCWNMYFRPFWLRWNLKKFSARCTRGKKNVIFFVRNGKKRYFL